MGGDARFWSRGMDFPKQKLQVLLSLWLDWAKLLVGDRIIQMQGV